VSELTVREETIEVIYDGIAFYPESSLSLEPNKRYRIQIIASEETVEKTPRNAWDILEEMAGTIEAPADWSSQRTSYL
jgi:predicted DNA-binding antitoxin AbrB/MazE fold protein